MNGILEMVNRASGAILAAGLNTLWLALAVAVVAWTGLRFSPRMNAATRHIVWWIVLAVMVALPIVPKPRGVRGAEYDTEAPAPRPASHVERLPHADQIPAIVERAAAGPQQFIEFRPGAWPSRIFAIWLVVFLFQMGRIAWSFHFLRGLKRRSRLAPELHRNFDARRRACGIKRPVSLLVSGEVVSPMAVGFLRPAVILPERLLGEFQESELDHVLLHELAHIARRDDWTNLAARLAHAALLLHPIAAWVLRRIEREREIACDDWVVSIAGSARPYAASLTRLFELCRTRRSPALATGMAERGSQLRERIAMLLRRERDFTPRASAMRVGMIGIALLVLVGAGLQRPRCIAFAQEPRETMGPAARAHASTADPAGNRARPANTKTFLGALVAAGFGDLSVEEIISLKEHGVSAQFLIGISQSGWQKLTSQDLIDLVQHGVTADYARQVWEAGLRDPSVRSVIDLKQHGVRPEDVHEIHDLGFGPYCAREAIDLSQHGVRPELFRKLKESGFTQLEPREVIEAQAKGLRGDNLRQARRFGSNLSLQQIIKLKEAGVI